MKKTTLEFLKKLKANNKKEWFNANREQYESARDDFAATIEALIKEIGRFDEGVRLLNAKDCVFRLHRDVRFSHDKSPYKTNFGAFLAPGGRKGGMAGYYLHLEPGGRSMLAGGIYMPDAPVLKALRAGVAERTDEFEKIIRSAALRRSFGELQGEKLKTVPRGYPREHPAAEFLKFKSYIVMKPMSDSAILSAALPREAAREFKKLLAFNEFLNRARKDA